MPRLNSTGSVFRESRIRKLMNGPPRPKRKEQNHKTPEKKKKAGRGGGETTPETSPPPGLREPPPGYALFRTRFQLGCPSEALIKGTWAKSQSRVWAKNVAMVERPHPFFVAELKVVSPPVPNTNTKNTASPKDIPNSNPPGRCRNCRTYLAKTPQNLSAGETEACMHLFPGRDTESLFCNLGLGYCLFVGFLALKWALSWCVFCRAPPTRWCSVLA